jgi:aminopeptidase N
VVNDDKRWFNLIYDVFQNFKYRTITTEEMVEFVNRKTEMNLTPIFDQYLRFTKLPTLELRFDETARSVSFRWAADVKEFAMPVRVGRKGDWQVIRPTTEWKTMPMSLARDQFDVATDLYFINVQKS